MLLANVPKPFPSSVWLLLTVGFGEVLQHTPRAVTAPPPSNVTLPPQIADIWETSVTLFVVTVGARKLTVTVTLAVAVQP